LIRRLTFMLLALALGAAIVGCSSSNATTSSGGTSSTTSAGTTTTAAKTSTSTTKATTTSETLAPGTVLAQVGTVAITQESFLARLAQVAAQSPTQVPDKATKPDAYLDFERGVLENMVRLELVKQKAGAINASVTDADVQNQIAQVLTQSFSGSSSKLEAALANQKMTLAQYQAGVRDQLLMQKAYDAVTKDVPAPSDAEIQAYYDAHQTTYFQAETRDVRHILILATGAASAGTKTTSSGSTTTTAAPTDADWAAAKALADKVRAEIAAGADFSQEAAKYSADTRSKDLGGSLGTIKKGQTLAEFEASAFSLAVGDLSQPVKTTSGYHIIRVDKIMPGKQLTLEEVKAAVTTAASSAAKKKAWEDWITTMKTELKTSYHEGMQTTTTTAGASTTTSTTGQ
jgi:parvulin-like peptidyl-prolyl isomerase